MAPRRLKATTALAYMLRSSRNVRSVGDLSREGGQGRNVHDILLDFLLASLSSDVLPEFVRHQRGPGKRSCAVER